MILEFVSKPDDLEFYSINPNAELSILPKDLPNPTKILNNKRNEFSYAGKIHKLPKNFDFNENFLFIPENVFVKFNLTSNKPYFLNYKLIKNRNNLCSLSNYLKKIENFNKKEPKKTPKTVFVYVKPLPNDFFQINESFRLLEFQNYVFIGSSFLKSMNLQVSLPIKLEFSTKITDFSRHKFCNILDFINPKLKFNIYLFPITPVGTFFDDLIKGEFINFITSNFLAKKVTSFYSGQIFQFKDLFFAIRLLENLPDKKNLLEMLSFEEIKPGMKFSIEELKSISKLAQEKIIIAKHQDYINNFPEKTVNSYNVFVKKKLNSLNKPLKIDFLQILFPNELAEIETFIMNFHKPQQKHLMGNFNSCLIWGNSGNGKSSLLKALNKKLLNVNFETIDFNEITNIKHSNVPPLDVIKGFVEGKIQLACIKEPTVVILDNLHLAAKNIERIDFQQSHEILVSEVFGKFVKDLMKKYKNVAFFAICDNKEFLNNQLTGKNLFFI